MDYKTAYLHLFNGVTDAIEQLMLLQQQAEETMITNKTTPLLAELPEQPEENQINSGT